jgi:hypothetical protein
MKTQNALIAILLFVAAAWSPAQPGGVDREIEAYQTKPPGMAPIGPGPKRSTIEHPETPPDAFQSYQPTVAAGWNYDSTHQSSAKRDYTIRSCQDPDWSCHFENELLTNQWKSVLQDGTNDYQAIVITSNYLAVSEWRGQTNRWIMASSNLVNEPLARRVVGIPPEINQWLYITNFTGTNVYWTNRIIVSPYNVPCAPPGKTPLYFQDGGIITP